MPSVELRTSSSLQIDANFKLYRDKSHGPPPPPPFPSFLFLLATSHAHWIFYRAVSKETLELLSTKYAYLRQSAR